MDNATHKGLGLVVVATAITTVPIVSVFLDNSLYFDVVRNTQQLAGLVALTLMFFQFVLVSRIRAFESSIGLDRLTQVHRSLGVAAYGLLLVHALVFYGNQLVNYGGIALDLPGDLPILQGSVALVVLTIAVAAAGLAGRLKLQHAGWLRVHRLSYIVFPLVYVHSWLIGSTVRYNPATRVLWITLGLGFVGIVAARLVRYGRTLRRPFRVAAVEPITHDIVRLSLEGPLPMYQAGQFGMLRLVDAQGRRSDAHPFTFSSAPGSAALQMSIKNSGDFSGAVRNTAVGSVAFVEGPYGAFTLPADPQQPLLWIAGGIGITPFLSMLGWLRATNRTPPVVLVWGNKTPADVGFEAEFQAALAANPRFAVVHVFSAVDAETAEAAAPPAVGTIEHGFVTEQLLTQHVAAVAGRLVYLCGPPPMVHTLRATLLRLGVPRHAVRFERFSL